MNHLQELARFVARLSAQDVPDEAWEAAKRSVLDTVSAAVGGAGTDQALHIRNTYLDLYGSQGRSAVWGCGEARSGPVAAFLNAMNGHILELDDVHTRSKVHIGTVVIPAAWAAAQALDRSGREFLLAAVCGYETAARVGMGFGVASHRSRGWHATSTAGIFGAAAACAKLMRLSEEQTLSALGIAGTQAFGTWAFLEDRAGNKILHPARAASSGYESACLSEAGMTGAAHILDATDGGLYAAMSDAGDCSRVSRGLGTCWEITRMDTKPYPCCRSTHCAIDGALALRNRFGVSADEIEHIQISTYLVGYQQCGHSAGSLCPATFIDAKFSTPYVVACALLQGGVTVQDFAPAAIADPAAQDLLRRVTVRPEDCFTQAYPLQWGCALTARLKDGKVRRVEVQDASGSEKNSPGTKQLMDKSLSLLTPCFGAEAPALADKILCMDTLPFLPFF